MRPAKRLGRALICCWCLSLAALGASVPAFADPGVGRLDRGFGEGGWTLTRPGVASAETGVELALAPDGSAVVAGAFSGPVVRFLPDGRPDRGFGEDGLLRLGPATLREGVEQLTFFRRSLAVDGRGRVLVFGRQTDTRETFVPSGQANGQPKSSAVVLRFTPEGRPDPTFGEGAGFIRSDFGLGSGLETAIPMVGVLAATVDSRDRPVFVAGASVAVSGCHAHGSVAEVPRAVVRLNEAGAPDPTFGADGVSPIGGSTEFPGLGLDAADQPVSGVGRLDPYHGGCAPGTAVFRLRQDGARIAGFGSDGVRIFRRFHLALVEPSGALILSRRDGRTLHLLRVRADGSRDKGFGRGGVAQVRLPAIPELHVKPAAVDAKGRILLVGFVGSPSAEPAAGRPRHSCLVVARLLADGRPDPGFGHSGWLFTRVPRALEATSAEGRFDSRGRLLVAATVTKQHHRNGALAVVRYLLGP